MNPVYIAKVGEKVNKIYETSRLLFSTDFNGKYIVGHGNLRGNPKSLEIFIYKIDTEEFKIYTPRENSVNEGPKLYHNKILFKSNFEGNTNLYIYDIDKEETISINSREKTESNIEFSDYINYGFTVDGKIWSIGLYNARGYAYIEDRFLNHPEGTPGNLEIYGDNIYMHFSSLKKPQSILKLTPNNNWVKIIGEDLPDNISNKLGKINITHYKSYDNIDVPCIIFETKEGKPGPTIIYVHGGPWSYVGDYWRIFIAALVASGYNVVAPNFRGSTGYGEEFRQLDIGDPGGGDLEDIVYARNYAYEEGIASKIAIMGYSYGGFMTYLATVKKPDLWDCGVAGAGIVDWRETYSLSDAVFREFIRVLFDNNEDLFRERSAINYVDNLKVPICIIHPQNDTRTPLKPVIEYCRKLLERNITFEVHITPDVGHLLTKNEDIVKVLFPAIVFLNKYLKRRKED